MILITGGAGFIGSAMLWELNRQGEEKVIIVDDLGLTTPAKWRNLSGLRYQDFIHIDDLPGLLERNALPDVSTIIHMGANSSTTETDADHLLTNNYEYSKKIAQHCMKRSVRLIYASSAATYGDGTNGYSDSTESIDALRPLNMYGYSKQLFDRWALQNGLFKTAAGLKFFNVYGPMNIIRATCRALSSKRSTRFRQPVPSSCSSRIVKATRTVVRSATSFM